MIYCFTINELRKAKVNVRTENPDEAQKIFSKWYDKHNDDPLDSTIDEMLEDGYEGRKIIRSIGLTEDVYSKFDPLWKNCLMLPEEADEPQEPKIYFHVRFADGSEPIEYKEMTLANIGIQLANLGNKYYLYPDSNIMYPISPEAMYFYAALKDQEETYYEFTVKENDPGCPFSCKDTEGHWHEEE